MCPVAYVRCLCVVLHMSGVCVSCYTCQVFICPVTHVRCLCVLLHMSVVCVSCYICQVFVCPVAYVRCLCVVLHMSGVCVSCSTCHVLFVGTYGFLIFLPTLHRVRFPVNINVIMELGINKKY